jgi:hypothetical protein
MSVVKDFDKLKRFNVEQLYDHYQSTQEKSVVQQESKGKESNLDSELDATEQKRPVPINQTPNDIGDTKMGCDTNPILDSTGVQE